MSERVGLSRVRAFRQLSSNNKSENACVNELLLCAHIHCYMSLSHIITNETKRHTNLKIVTCL